MTAVEPAVYEELARTALACTKCGLCQSRTQVVWGVGDTKSPLLFIGEGPGKEEDLQGEPFVGRSGKLLDKLVLEEMNLKREQFYIANVVKCRPPNNRDPLPEEIEACTPYLRAQIEYIAPKVIITLGNFSTRFILETKDGISKLRGKVYPYSTGVVVPTFHPSAALQGGGDEVIAKMRADLVRAKEQIVAAGVDL
jgi:uracil-DNA glycosylase family 4